MNDPSKSSCSRHSREPATAFCLKHEQKLCMKCLLGAHKDCVHEDNVEYINKTDDRVENEFPETIRIYEHLSTSSKKWTEKYQCTLEKLQQTEDRLLTGIKQMQQRIVEQTNRLATDALEITKSVLQDQKSMVQNDVDQLEEFNRKVKDIESNIERCKTDKDIVVGEMLYIVNTVKNLHAKFQHTELIDRDVKVHFYVSEELQYIRNKLISFGELCVEDPNCRNTGLRSRPSKISLAQSFSIDSISDDEIDSSVFVLPKDRHGTLNDTNIYCSIHVEQPPTPCPPAPPLPDMHPETPIEEKLMFNENREKFKTLPRMKIDHHVADATKTNSFYDEAKATTTMPIPSLPKKRASSLRESGKIDIPGENNITGGAREPNDPISHRPTPVKPDTDSADTGLHFTTKDQKDSNGESIEKRNAPEIKVRPPTTTRKLAEMFENKAIEEQNKLNPKLIKSPHSHLKRDLGKNAFGSEGSINTLKDSSIVIGGDKIPPLPKMHKPRFSASRHIDSIKNNNNDVRHSDSDFIPNNIELPISSQPSSSLSNLPDVGKHTPSLSSDSSFETTRSFYSASSNASLLSSESRDFDSPVSDETFTYYTDKERKTHTEMRFVPPLDTHSRKSVSFNLSFGLHALGGSPKSPPPPHHSTINGIAVTTSGLLFICDIENHCLQLFDTSGTPLYDYQIKEPFSCCTIRDDVVAVTSRDRKTLCIFDISDSKISCRQEQFISADVDIFGVGYTKGFFGICCGDCVVIITESLQPYRTVSPVVMVKKKKAKPYFVDVKYIAMEWSKLGFFIYTSEHKCDRVSCVVVGSRDRPVWNAHVGKPKSVLLCKENVLVAAKHKVVMLEAASGQRMREIHHEVPTHPIHMVVWDGWLYISKHSSSNVESRNVRKLPFTST